MALTLERWERVKTVELNWFIPKYDLVVLNKSFPKKNLSGLYNG
jgi:hypothetical protein